MKEPPVPTLVACVASIAAIPAGFAAVRMLPAPLAFSALVVGVPTAALAGAPLLALGALAGAGAAVVLALRAGRDQTEQRSELEVAQERAEEAVEALAGQAGGAMHEDLAIGALLAAISATDPAEQLAGFRQAEQLARAGAARLIAA